MRLGGVVAAFVTVCCTHDWSAVPPPRTDAGVDAPSVDVMEQVDRGAPPRDAQTGTRHLRFVGSSMVSIRSNRYVLQTTVTLTIQGAVVTGTYVLEPQSRGSLDGVLRGSSLDLRMMQTMPCAGALRMNANLGADAGRLMGVSEGDTPCTGTVRAAFELDAR